MNVKNVASEKTILSTKIKDKNYEIINQKRVFEKKKVVYTSNYSIYETSENLYIDKDSNKEYIVNFI